MGNLIRHSLLAGVLLWPLSGWGEGEEEALVLAETTPVPPPSEHLRWLDEVRAQRQAWEARRQAAKESADAHRRMIDPWGAALHEALEREAQARREALANRAEQRRQAAEQERDAHQQEINRLRQERERFWKFYTPYDWDTHWFYRGY
jgi:hypothetical protein